MNLDALTTVLSDHPDAALHLMLPDGSFVPAHFHVTEVGRVRKDFIDCGGTARSTTACVLQVWVADDTEHRLDAAKLAKILRLGSPLFESMSLPVEIEYENDVVSQYPIGGAEVTPSGILLVLVGKHTACLAPDRCGVPSADSPSSADGCCSAPGCC